MAQAIGRWPLNVEARFHVRVNPYGICGESGTGKRFSLNSSDFSCQYDFTLALNVYLYHLGHEQ
jgi:hypothetical protein